MRKVITRYLGFLSIILFFTGCAPRVADPCSLREKHADYDLEVLDLNLKLSDEPLSLEQILEIALCRNLDLQLQELELCVNSKEYIAKRLALLPYLEVNGYWSDQNKNDAWFSETPPGSHRSKNATLNCSPQVNRFDITIAYNLLDLGLTYIRSRQDLSITLMTEQRNLRARQNLILDIYRIYYRAIVARMAMCKSELLINALQMRQRELQEQIQTQLICEMNGLLNENRIIDMEYRLQVFESDYYSAITELSALMGYRPGRPLELAEIEVMDVIINPFCVDLLDEIALHFRPELLAQDLQHQIQLDEVRAAIVRMFPCVNFFFGIYEDRDDFRLHNQWFKVGTTLSYDLLSLPSKAATLDSKRVQAMIAWDARISMSMGILTQVRLAFINVHEQKKQYELARDLMDVKLRQFEISQHLERVNELNADDVLEFEVEALLAEVNTLNAYANLQIALEQLGNSIGKPLFFSFVREFNPPRQIEVCCDWSNEQYEAFDYTQVIQYIPAQDVKLTIMSSPHYIPPKEKQIEEEEEEFYDDEVQQQESEEEVEEEDFSEPLPVHPVQEIKQKYTEHYRQPAQEQYVEHYQQKPQQTQPTQEVKQKYVEQYQQRLQQTQQPMQNTERQIELKKPQLPIRGKKEVQQTRPIYEYQQELQKLREREEVMEQESSIEAEEAAPIPQENTIENDSQSKILNNLLDRHTGMIEYKKKLKDRIKAKLAKSTLEENLKSKRIAQTSSISEKTQSISDPMLKRTAKEIIQEALHKQRESRD